MQKIIGVTAAAAAIYLCAVQAGQTAPLRCSAEEKACIAMCNNNSNLATVPNCIAGCRARMSTCRQTGCWVNGPSRYCGLTRQ